MRIGKMSLAKIYKTTSGCFLLVLVLQIYTFFCAQEHLLVDDPSCVPCLSENSSEPQEFWKVSNRWQLKHVFLEKQLLNLNGNVYRLARLKSELEGAKSAILKLNGEKAILRHERCSVVIWVIYSWFAYFYKYGCYLAFNSDAGRQRHAECFGELLKVKQANASLMKLLADTQMQLQQSQVSTVLLLICCTFRL